MMFADIKVISIVYTVLNIACESFTIYYYHLYNILYCNFILSLDTNSGYNLTFSSSSIGSDVFEVMQVDSQYGIIIITNIKPLDREVMSSYTLTLIASDKQDSSINSTAQLIINIMDVNDNPPYITNATGSILITENKQIGDEVCFNS